MKDVSVGPSKLPGLLGMAKDPSGLVIFAHGSGSSRLSPRNMHVAGKLRERGMASLLFDLLTPAEAEDRNNVFDIPLLAERLEHAIDWVKTQDGTATLPVALFGASTGAAAALVAAARKGRSIASVVSRGGRPDLAGAALAEVKAPTMLIVGAADPVVLELNREALRHLRCDREMVIIPRATHLFEEPGTLDAAIDHAAAWFADHFNSKASRAAAAQSSIRGQTLS